MSITAQTLVLWELQDSNPLPHALGDDGGAAGPCSQLSQLFMLKISKKMFSLEKDLTHVRFKFFF